MRLFISAVVLFVAWGLLGCGGAGSSPTSDRSGAEVRRRVGPTAPAPEPRQPGVRVYDVEVEVERERSGTFLEVEGYVRNTGAVDFPSGDWTVWARLFDSSGNLLDEGREWRTGPLRVGGRREFEVYLMDSPRWAMLEFEVRFRGEVVPCDGCMRQRRP